MFKKFLKNLLLPTVLLFGLFVGGYESRIHENALKATCNVDIYGQNPNELKFIKKLVPADAKIEIPVTKIGGGTGVCIAEDKESYFILSAGHVTMAVKKDEGGYLELEFDDINIKESVQAEIIYQKPPKDISEHVEFGIIEIKKENLHRKLSVIPIGENIVNKVFTAGCCHGERASIVESKIILRGNGTLFIDLHPGPGRSGSGVFTSDGARVVGIITRANGECVASSEILKILKKELPGIDFDPKNAIMGYDGQAWLFLIQCTLLPKNFLS